MRKISKIVAPVALIMVFMLFSPHEAMAGKFFGRDRTSEYAGSYGGCAVIFYTYDVYFFGFRTKTGLSDYEVVGDCVPSMSI
jgi:hypothetical protein